jgi:undecaprenyl-diphosphatase
MKKTFHILIAGILLLVISFLIDHIVIKLALYAQNPMLSYIFGWLSSIISLVLVLLVMTSLFMWEENKKHYILPLWLSFASALLLVYIIKFLVKRGRPGEAMEVLGFQDYSFPSAHAAVSFSALPILDKEFPMLKWFWLLFASLVALSRIYLGVHYLSDVIAGILLGYLVGRLILEFLKDKGFRHGA